MLPNGRIFGQITQKQATKNLSWPEKIGGKKLLNFAKCGIKQTAKHLYNFLEAKLLNYLQFLGKNIGF
jgi:hypothetical protein